MASVESVLTGDHPGRGEPESIHGLGTHLARQTDGVLQVHAAIVQSRSAFAGQQATACDRAEQLLARPQQLAVSLSETAQQSSTQLHWYAGEVSELDLQAERVRSEAADLLQQIARCRRELIASGGFTQMVTTDWRAPSAAGVDRLAQPGAEMADAELQRRAGRAAEAERVLSRWRALEGEVDRLIAAWQRLQSRRSEVNTEMCARANGLSLPAQCSGTGYDGALVAMRGLHGWAADRASAQAYLQQMQHDPAAVGAFWVQLDESTRAELITGASWFVGGLAGVPFVDRIAANRHSAEDVLHDAEESHRQWEQRCPQGEATNGDCAMMLPRSQEQLDYLRGIVSGERQLVVFDPRNDRLVEVIGDISRPATHVMTYLPGTGADLHGFYRNETQQVANYLVRDLNETSGGNAVAFVYKDGPWPSWAGERANTNERYLSDLGSRVAEFERQIGAQPNLADARRVGIGHSAGHTIQLAAETHGAHRHRVLGIGGAYAPQSWTAADETLYFSYNYEGDAIRVIDRVSDASESLSPSGARLPYQTASASDFFAHRFFPEVEGDSAIDQHNRIAKGPDENERALGAMRDDILGRRPQ
ncbi:hypothetical protein F8O06_01880 [Pseudoclavibacter sp. CFCC 14310]|uniref:hypothetical protein n=1 Tax=Pseudoclavibacter sp. CFCC 14310 TaxID=2615180 RepID=UPI001301387B|nr:hypothetical protein [Pseudoclavibacter sp. CFCC 14310]KAB1647339.1 hypothetical protein F8O06_01880 [Pseudoclavibacter sp. CFCC 14310]